LRFASLEKLQQRVPVERAAFGVAFDGDADRSLFVSSDGKSSTAMAFCSPSALSQIAEQASRNRVVATSMSNLGSNAFSLTKYSLARTNVGDRYVLEEMLKSGNVSAANNPATLFFSTTLRRRRPSHRRQKSLRSSRSRAASILSSPASRTIHKLSST